MKELIFDDKCYKCNSVFSIRVFYIDATDLKNSKRYIKNRYDILYQTCSCNKDYAYNKLPEEMR